MCGNCPAVVFDAFHNKNVKCHVYQRVSINTQMKGSSFVHQWPHAHLYCPATEFNDHITRFIHYQRNT